MGLSEAVKAQHRLPFFANFVHLAARVEDLLSTLEPSAPGAAPTRPTAEQHTLAPGVQSSPVTWHITCCQAHALHHRARPCSDCCVRAAAAGASADADRASEPASRATSVDSGAAGAPLHFGGSTAGDGGALEYELTDEEDYDAPSSRSSQDAGCGAPEKFAHPSP